jgi:uncharacterized protein (UPF0303 family)
MTEYADRIAEVVTQEQRLRLHRFDNADAWSLGTLLVELALERGHAITVDITRSGHQVFRAAMPGASPDQSDWIARKNRLVMRFGVSSYLFGLRLAASDRSLADEPQLDPALYAAHGGAFPLHVAGVGVIGTVTVSGLPQADDHALVVEALSSFLAE